MVFDRQYYSWSTGKNGPIKELGDKYEYLEYLKAELDNQRPLPPGAVQNLKEEFSLQYTYNSNAIEGNSLTLMETMCVLKHGITIGGKPLREHYEVVNHDKAIILLEDLAKNKQPVNETNVIALHSMVLKNINEEYTGEWRKIDVFIQGASHEVPKPKEVPKRMEEFFNWYNTDAQKLPAVERASRVHTDFVSIHPFVDGNGRTARLLMNLELFKAGYPLAIIQQEKRMDYYKNLDMAAALGSFKPFTKMVCSEVERSFKMYSKVLDCNLEIKAKKQMNNNKSMER